MSEEGLPDDAGDGWGLKGEKTAFFRANGREVQKNGWNLGLGEGGVSGLFAFWHHYDSHKTPTYIVLKHFKNE